MPAPPPPRPSSSATWATGGCVVSPAATVAPSRKAALGVCKVRFQKDGVLRVPRGYVGALQSTRSRRNRFNHAMPGALALSFGMLGCDLHCAYRQNWFTSQTLRDGDATAIPREYRRGGDRRARRDARRPDPRLRHTTSRSSPPSGPWKSFARAKRQGSCCAYVSNGNATPEVLAYIRPWVDALQGRPEVVRDKALPRARARRSRTSSTRSARIHALGFWLECLTLVIPGFNDSDEELRDAGEIHRFRLPDIPWHVTAFHPDYKMDRTPPTPASPRFGAPARSARSEGLRFVYAGNIPGRRGRLGEHPAVPAVRRPWSSAGASSSPRIACLDGRCFHCGETIPGRWEEAGRRRRSKSRFQS